VRKIVASAFEPAGVGDPPRGDATPRKTCIGTFDKIVKVDRPVPGPPTPLRAIAARLMALFQNSSKVFSQERSTTWIKFFRIL
jgi:Ni,Fe-hydrogenase III small subunit